MRKTNVSRPAFWGFVGLIVYTYVGYPAAIALLARLRPRRRVPSTINVGVLPSVTVVIAAHNEEQHIVEKIEETLALDYPRDRLRVIVATDGSTDSTLAIVEGYATRGVCSSHANVRAGKAAAVTRAMHDVDSDIVLFSDANNHYGPQLMRTIVAPFDDPTVGVVTGAKVAYGDNLVGHAEGLYWRYEDAIKRHETQLGCCTSAVGEVLAIRREVWQEPPTGIINDDYWLTARAIARGWDVVYEPRAMSSEKVSASAKSEVERRARIVAGRYQALTMSHHLIPRHRPFVAWQMISHKLMRPLVPFAMVGALVSNLSALRRGRPGLVPHGGRASTVFLLLLQALFYGAAAIAPYGQQLGPLGRLLYVPRFLVDSNAAALKGFVRFAMGSQSAAWQRPDRRRD